jgi:hypothetical protein
MPDFRLRLAAPETVTAAEAASSFCWTEDARSTVIATLAPTSRHLGPNLGALGPVAGRNIDLVRIAVAVYCADRSASRSGGGSNWNRRPIGLTIPVLDVAVWQAAAAELKTVTDLLTGDDWSFEFTSEQSPAEDVVMPTSTPKRVVLLSGGADSAVGALLSRSALELDDSHTLVSHFSSTLLAPLQRDIADRIAGLVPGPSQEHVQAHLGRGTKRLDGKAYRDEPTNRSRSLLFLALGLAIASVHDITLWIPENGFASLNPPLGPERLGSLSTRTTHPAFITGLGEFLATIGAHNDIVNPFAGVTKGEMFARAAELVGADEATQLLSATNSCAHTGQRNFKISTSTPCGVCFGCLVRRASFVASGLSDQTPYISPDANPELRQWLDGKSIERSVERFVRKGVRTRDLIAMNLPRDYDLDVAMELCQRGTAELAGLFK